MTSHPSEARTMSVNILNSYFAI